MGQLKFTSAVQVELQTLNTDKVDYVKPDLTPSLSTHAALMSLIVFSSNKDQLLACSVSQYPSYWAWLRDLAVTETSFFKVAWNPVESKRVFIFHVVLNHSEEGHITAGLCYKHCPRTWERSTSTQSTLGLFPSFNVGASGVPDEPSTTVSTGVD